MREGEVRTTDGRTVAYADYGEAGQTAVLWCHGGPGSRLEPAGFAPDAAGHGIRIIGIDRRMLSSESCRSWATSASSTKFCRLWARWSRVLTSCSGREARGLTRRRR